MADAWVIGAGVGLVALTALFVWLVVQAVSPQEAVDEDRNGARGASSSVDGGSRPQGSETALVFVYRHGCPACKPLFPIIDALTRVHGANLVYKVVSTADREFVNANNIQRVPVLGTLDVNTNKIVTLFSGPRTQSAIEAFGHERGLW
jgi:hypothetical protein